MLEKLLEALDENVFTPEMKSEIEKEFNEAVEEKAQTLAEALASEKISDVIDEMTEKVEALEAKQEAELAEAKEALENEFKEKEQAILESVDTYLDKAVLDFVNESKVALEESVKTAKADLIIESVSAALTAAGINITKIVEGKTSEEPEAKLSETVQKYDALMESFIALEKENDKLMKAGIISEMKEGLSMVEADKFEKLAAVVEFSKDAEYVARLETLRESLVGTKEASEKLDESLEESAKETSKFIDARFI